MGVLKLHFESLLQYISGWAGTMVAKSSYRNQLRE